jgi:hypothetical protein
MDNSTISAEHFRCRRKISAEPLTHDRPAQKRSRARRLVNLKIRSQSNNQSCKRNGETVMAINLTSVVSQILTPEIIAQIASLLGLDRAVTQKAAQGAVPSLLAVLSDVVSTPAGTNQLSKLLSQQITGSATDILRNASPQGLVESGSSMLSGLFGDRAFGDLAQAVGKFAGTGTGGAKSLLAVLGPIVLGALGQQQRDAGLGANGLVSLLRSQKDQILEAIPSGLADQLGAAGLIDRTEGELRNTAASAAAGAARVASAGSGATQTTYNAITNTAGRWPYWLAALIVLGGLAWYAIDRQDQPKVAEQPAATPMMTGTVGAAPADLTVDGVNLAGQINASINTLKSALPGITDAGAAQAALPKINEAIAQLSDVSARAAKLSPEGRSALAKLIVVATPSINQMCDKIIATPGAGPIAKPTIDDLRAKLDSLSRA